MNRDESTVSTNKTSNSLIRLVGTIVIVILLIYILWRIPDWFQKIASLDSVIIVALVTGVTSLFATIVSRVMEYRAKRREYLNHKREKAYKEFIGMVYKLHKNVREANYSEEEMMNDLYEFSEELTLWGSSNVVDKWIQYREQADRGETGEKILFLWEDIINEMRNDFGTGRVKRGNILSFIINDVQRYSHK